MTCDNPFIVKILGRLDDVPVPCGRCYNCIERRVNDWVFRCTQEQKRSSSSYFVTLTYDTTHVPISEKGRMTLDKKDFQDYMKRLRHHFKAPLKYYMCGEYGSKKWRPHYHVILFNADDPKHIADEWKFGNVDIQQMSAATVAYTAKYIQKTARVPAYPGDDRMPEFSLMSKKLGDNYLTKEMVKYHKADLSRNFATEVGGKKIALPRYYRKKIYTEDELKLQRQIIHQAVNEHRDQDEKQFRQTYGEEADYHSHTEYRRIARSQKINKHERTRN